MSESSLLTFAEGLNKIACSMIEQDGEHVAMYFLAHGDGRVESCLFEEENPSESVGPVRARQLADAARASGADAVVMVSEAWSAHRDDVPEGGRVRDTSGAQDILLLVGIDRSGETVVLETPVFREPGGTTRVGETTTGNDEWRVATLNGVRAVWGMPQHGPA